MLKRFTAMTVIFGLTTFVASSPMAFAASATGSKVDTTLTSASTQSSDGGTAVDRSLALLPDNLKPVGFEMGSFKLLPRLDLSTAQQGNIFATDTQEVSGNVNTAAPSLDLISQWDRHSLEFVANLTAVNYPSNSTENFASSIVGAYGRYDFGSKNNAFVNLTRSRSMQPRSQEGADNKYKEPIQSTTQNAEAGVVFEGDQFKLMVSGASVNYDYDNATLANGTTVSQNFRNRDETYATVRAEYVISPEGSVYVVYTGNDKSYDNDTLKRSSKGHEAALGVSYKPSDSLNMMAQFGQSQQDYESRFVGDKKFNTYLADLSWVATPSTRFHLSSSRKLQETSVKTSSGYLGTVSGVSAEQWLTPNLVIVGSYNQADNDYEDIDRTDTIKQSGVGLTWYFSNKVNLGLDYDVSRLTSKGAQATTPFDDQTVSLSIGLAY